MNKILSILIAIFVIVFAGIGLVQVVSKAQTTPQLLSTLGVDDEKIRPGQDFQYTAKVTNTSTVNAQNIRINLTLASELTYVAGTTTANKEGKTVNIIDDWITTGTNLGTLDAGKTVYLFFRAKVKDNTTVGVKPQSVIQVKADGLDWAATAISIEVISPNLTTSLKGGNFVKVVNVTKASGWQDETVSADLGNIIEYDIYITNTGSQVAKNVRFRADLPGQDQQSSSLHPRITLSADNAADVVDTVTVNVNSPTWMEYYPGHAKKFGNTGLYDCGSVNGCAIPEVFYYNAMNIGDVQPGESKAIQIGFKSLLVNLVTQTPTPTPSMTPTPTPTATPTATPTSTPTSTPTPSPTPTSNATSSCSNLVASVTSGTKPLTVTFTGSGNDSNGSIQQYQFNFGDSSEGQAQIITTSSNQVTHVYHNAGNFIANLIVKDSRGNWVGGGNCQLNINVNNPPTVLGTSVPKTLPKTGSNDGIYLVVASIPTVIFGIYLYRRFKLL
jgi:uncharacterized repeat protein (TIGR01451 family)